MFFVCLYQSLELLTVTINWQTFDIQHGLLLAILEQTNFQI